VDEWDEGPSIQPGSIPLALITAAAAGPDRNCISALAAVGCLAFAVIPTAQVNKFKMNNPTWKDMHPSAWGKALNVDYVLDIHLDKLRLYQPGSLNALYEGHGEVSVFMYDVAEGVAEPKYYVHDFHHPKTGVRDATAIPLGAFKKEYLERLAVELAQYHVDHKISSGIAEGR